MHDEEPCVEKFRVVEKVFGKIRVGKILELENLRVGKFLELGKILGWKN